MQFGLPDNTIEKIKSVFASFPEVEEVVLYGSRAKGNFRPGSDIDLTLKGAALNHSFLSKISLNLDDLLLPYTFDLSIYHQLQSPEFLDHIHRVGVVFYQR